MAKKKNKKQKAKNKKNEAEELQQEVPSSEEAVKDLAADAAEETVEVEAASASEAAPEEAKEPLSEDALAAMERAIEALVFASPKPLSLQKIKRYLESAELPTDDLSTVMNNLVESFEDRGLQMVKVAKSFQFRTNPTQSTIVEKLVEDKPARLSKSALEVLAIVSYKQPITRSEIDSVRGIDSGHLMKGLLEKNLVRTDGHADTVGRPLLYVTTPYFLEVFSLDSLDALPNLEEFQRELNAGAEGETSILEADPDFFERDSPLAAEPDRGQFDEVTEEEIHAPDFGLLENNEEEEDTAEDDVSHDKSFEGPPAQA